MPCAKVNIFLRALDGAPGFLLTTILVGNAAALFFLLALRIELGVRRDSRRGETYRRPRLRCSFLCNHQSSKDAHGSQQAQYPRPCHR